MNSQNSDSHVKTYAEITPLEALKLLAANEGNPVSSFAFKDIESDGYTTKYPDSLVWTNLKDARKPFMCSDGIWWTYCARVTLAPKIADGHNPDRLTVDQVGVNDGWRLISREEVENGNGVFPFSQWWTGKTFTETSIFHCSCISSPQTIRTKQPAGFYLPPKPATRTALKPWDFASAPRGLVMLRLKSEVKNDFIIARWTAAGITILSGSEFTYPELLSRFEHSTDFVNWSPCGSA